MKLSTIRLVTTAAFAVGGFGVAYVASKQIIRRKCRAQVKDKCMKVPFLDEDECDLQAAKICDV